MAKPRPRPTTKTLIQFGRIKSPIGAIVVACVEDKLCALEFADAESRLRAWLKRRYGDFQAVEAADPGGVCTGIGAYLLGDLDALDGIAVDTGGTEFQRKVWKALTTIPVGETWSYAQLAAAIGKPKAVRAVGRACATNPVSVVIPCHRVLRGDGSLGGYRWGLDRKQALLEQERLETEAAQKDPAGS